MDEPAVPSDQGTRPGPQRSLGGEASEASPGVRRPSTRLYTVVLILLSPLLLVCVGLALGGEFGRWSVFWTSDPVKNIAEENRFDRWETHFMLGRGVVALRRYSVFSAQPFDFAGAELNSRELAWATLSQPAGTTPQTAFRWDTNGPTMVLPAWPLGVAALCVCCVPIAVAWRRRRATVRELRLQCRRCAYDLRGLPDASVCPECARPISAWVREQVIGKH